MHFMLLFLFLWFHTTFRLYIFGGGWAFMFLGGLARHWSRSMEEHMSAVVETQSLRKEYGTLVAVRDANLVIEEGRVVGLVGPNGAGKTTLLRMLATLLRPQRFQIRKSSSCGRGFGHESQRRRS